MLRNKTRAEPLNSTKEWSEWFSHAKSEKQQAKQAPVLIFRLGERWFAFNVLACRSVEKLTKIRRLPYFSKGMLEGVVNIKGKLHLSISLRTLLEIEPSRDESQGRIIVLEKEQETWAFPVEEIKGIYYFNESELLEPNRALEEQSTTFVKGFLAWDKVNIAYIDDELLFYSLRRGIW